MKQITWKDEINNLQEMLDEGKSTKEIAEHYQKSTAQINSVINFYNLRRKSQVLKAEQWSMLNKVLNKARELTGKELVPASENPYIQRI